MAKFGKFVGEKRLSFTNEEKNAIIEHFKTIIKANSPVDMKYTISTDNEYESFNINFIYNSIYKRNHLKERITFYGITFSIRKMTGYLDITDWCKSNVLLKDYENAPEYQYSVSMICHGTEIPYRCRKHRGLQMKGSYQFDTEISNLIFDVALKHLFTEKLK